MRKSLRSWLGHVLLFFILIVYWECLLQTHAFGAQGSMRGWFLLFALPQAAIPAALCAWGKERLSRLIAALLALLLCVFYCAHLIYFRIFGSMISLSMVGVGGAAIENFGWALRSTLSESVGWLALFALPVAALVVWIFIPKPEAGRIPPVLRLVSLGAAALLWLLAYALLPLGGTSDVSAYYAYTSSLVDTDSSAQKLGVLTTSELEAGSMFFGRSEESEMAQTEIEFVPAPLPTAQAETPLAAETPEPEAELSPDGTGAETAKAPLDRSRQIFEEIDFAALAEKTDDKTIRDLCNYFASVPGTRRNKYTGLLEGSNLILICAESFSNISISEEVTPTLYRMANEGIVLTNFYNSFKNTTTNGEFAFLTGLWPDVSRKADWGSTAGSFAQSADHYMPYGLGNIFADMGVKSYMFHNYTGDYYARNKTHANLGYICRFSDTMQLTERWPSSDLEMMQQTVDDYIHEDRFNVYYMTFSGHGPYNIDNNPLCARNFSSVPEVINGRKMNVLARCFFASSLELEWSVDYLLQRLEEEGKLDNTLIVIVGDHYPYYLSDTIARSILGELPDRAYGFFHSTCIMWSGAIKEPIVCNAPCCNVDILPTVLNLLGIDYDSRMLSGTDILSDSAHMAVLWNKTFITDTVKYCTVDGKYVPLGDGEKFDRTEMRAYIDSVKNEIVSRYAAALAVNRTDFYRFVWENSGLLPAADEAS